MNTGDVVPELDVDGVQADDNFRHAAGNGRLVVDRQIPFREYLIDLGPALVPHFGLDTLPQGIFDLKEVLAKAEQQISIEILVPRFTMETKLQPRPVSWARDLKMKARLAIMKLY